MENHQIESLVTSLATSLAERNYDRFLFQFAADAVFETPFSIETGGRYDGLDEIKAHFGRIAQNPLFKVIRWNNINTDWSYDAAKHIISVEYFANGTILASGATFELQSSVAHIKIEGNEILHYKDFPNTLGLMKAAGLLSAFAQRLTA